MSDKDIAPDTFLELIADREFLFLEYSELYASWDYPPLSFLVSALDAEEKNYSQGNCDTVLNQAFVPTEANYEDFRSWQGNLKELKSAREQRTWQMKNLSVLYDQLLELFIKMESSDKDTDGEGLKKCRENAKFAFYHFTRYDRYYHYDLERFWSCDSPNIHFSYRENYRDGVDFFGNLLRFHINHCMPNRAEGLEPVLDPSHDKRNPPLTLLTTFLLAEASSGVPAKERLSNRVYNLVNSNSGEEMLVQYEKDYWTRSTRRHDLIRWVREHDLHIPREEILLFEENRWNPVTQNCGQYVLEYFLRDRMIQKSKEVLYQTAQSFFSDLFFGVFSYDDFSL